MKTAVMITARKDFIVTMRDGDGSGGSVDEIDVMLAKIKKWEREELRNFLARGSK